MFKPHFILAIITLLVSLFNPAQATEQPSSLYGIHGMTLFGGEDGLFASHLPMYHQPHNVQMIMQFHFVDIQVDNAVKKRLQQQATQPQQLWTIVPQPFDLMTLKPTIDNALPQLTIDVVEGHFERGGVSQFFEQAIMIDKIMLFSTLDMQQGQPKSSITDYLNIAASPTSPNQFLIKRLESRPEADHLLRVTSHDLSDISKIAVTTASIHPSVTEITTSLNAQTNRQELHQDDVIEVYLETDELQ
ncbi:hypothetical protein AB4140_13230 [Shewanella sp. 10N.286.51.B2]|uniref:hypothetical protein n=1 Tax=Shewanella sp. 10N.286.51.B2 TaxID=3229707 RepID=UPI00354D0B37